MLLDAQGIYHRIPGVVYHADPCVKPSLSSGVLRALLERSPLHAKLAHPRLNPDYARDEDDRFDLGTAAHQYVLEGTADFVVVDASDWRTKAAKEQRDGARASGKTPLLASQWETVQAMASAFHDGMARHEIGDLLRTPGNPEATCVWKESDTWCRARFDWLPTTKDIILDYKTTGNASPDAFSRTIFSLGYDVQAAWYLRGARAVVPGKDWSFCFVAQETEPPYALSVCEPSEGALDLARRRIERGLEIWRECLASDAWPAYPTSVAVIQPPSWVNYREAEEEAREPRKPKADGIERYIEGFAP